MIFGEKRFWGVCCSAAVCVAILCSPAVGDTVVTFPDANLEAGVRSALGIAAPTPITATAMLGLTSLSVPFTGIADLAGIEYAANLSKLWIGGNNITSLTPLAGLGNLTFLEMDYLSHTVDLAPLGGLPRLETLFADMNDISDITSLSGLVSLHELSLQQNLVFDIGPIKDLPALYYLNLMHNQIVALPILNAPVLHGMYLNSNEIADLSNLAASNLPRLDTLQLLDNPLSQDAYDIYIPQLMAARPELAIAYDPIPEPATCLLLGLGLVLTVGRRHRIGYVGRTASCTKSTHQKEECR